MRKYFANLSLLLALLMVFQLLVPAGSAFAASVASPTNLTASLNTPSDVMLKWNSVTGATNYKVYEVTNGQNHLLYTVSGNLRIVNGVSQGVHSYAVSALSGTTESPLSTPVSVTISYPQMAAPATFTSTIVNANDVTLKWATASYAQTYNLYEIVNGVKKLLFNMSSTTKTIFGVPEGKHQYVVTSVHPLYGESADSQVLDVDVVRPVIQPPTNLKGTVLNGNDIALSWTAAEFATNYKVYEVINGERVLQSTVNTTAKTFSRAAEGTHVYEVVTYSDRFGESATAATTTVNLVYPVLLPPTNIKTSIIAGNDLRIDWTSANFATSYNVYQLENGQRKLVGSSVTNQKVLSNMPEGDYKFEITSVSERFGESKTAVAFEAQVIYPLITAPQNGRYSIINGNDLTLNWSAVEFANRYELYEVKDGQRTLVTTATGFGYVLKNMPEGNFLYEVYSVSDRFGKSAEGLQIAATVKYPVMQPPSKLTPTVANGNDLTLTWTSSEFANYYNVYQLVDGEMVFKFSANALSASLPRQAEGFYTYEVRSFSTKFGESPTGTRADVQIGYPELRPPTIKLAMVNNTSAEITWQSALYAETYNVYRLVDGQPVLIGATKLKSFTIADMDDTQTYDFVVTTAHSRFGESRQSNVVSAKFDFNPPTTVATVPKDWVNRNVAVDVTARDDKSGVEVTYFSVNDGPYVAGTNVLIEQEGITKISFYSIDKAGNMEEPHSVEVKIDKVAPVTQYELVGSSSSPTAIKLTASDDRSGIAYTHYQVNDGPFLAVTDPLIPITADIRTIAIYSVDKARNEEVKQTIRLAADNTPPVTTSNVVAEWQADEFQVDLQASDDVSGVEKTYYALDGGDFLEGSSLVVGGTIGFSATGEGVHPLKFYSVDKVGNREAVQTVDVRIDKSAPITASNLPTEWQKADFLLTLNPKDKFSGVAKTFLATNGGEFAEAAEFNFQEEGIHSVSFYSVDNVGHEEAVQSGEVKIDKTAPITVHTVKKNADGSMVIDLVALDMLSGVAKTVYKVNGQETEGTSLTITEPGTYTIEYYSVDQARNVEKQTVIEMVIDTLAPVTTVNLTDKWYKEDLDVKLSASDDISGVDKTFYKLNGGEQTEGTTVSITEEGIHSLTFHSKDKAGNVEEVKTALAKLDKTAPVTASNLTEGDRALPGYQVVLNPEDNLSGVAKTYYSVNGAPYVEGTSFELGHGVTSVSYYSEDNAGNIERVTLIKLVADITAPVTVSDIEDKWFNRDVTVNLIATDDMSGVAQTLYSVDGGALTEGTTFTVSGEGVHTVTFYSVDKAGNNEETRSAEVKIDLQAPTTTTTATDGYYTGAIELKFLTADNLSGADKTMIVVNDQSPAEGESYVLDQSGTYKITFYSIDKAGNAEAAQTLNITLDTQAPVTVSDVKEGWSQQDVTVNLTATDELSGVDKTYYSVDGAEYQEGTAFTVSGNGIHTVTFYSIDKAGNKENVKTKEVKIDGVAPVTAADATDGFYNKALDIKLSAKDDLSGVDKSYYTINGGEVQKGSKISLTTSGTYKVTYYSADIAGNVEQAKELNVTIDENAPVTVSDVKDEWSQKPVAVNLTATDDFSGVDKTYYAVDGGEYQEGTSFTVSGNGIHTISFYSVDKAGNVEAAHTQEVKIDDVAPVTVTDFKDGFYKGEQLVNLVATDDLSGIAKTVYTINGGEPKNGASISLKDSGTYAISYYSMDNAGNVEAVKALNITIDNQAPVTVSDADGNWTNQTVTVHLTATDDLSGVDKTYYAVNDGQFAEGNVIEVAQPGIHTITFYSVDKVGNVEAKKTATVKIDLQAPVTTAEAPTDWTQQSAIVALTATDDLSGVAATYYSVDGGEFVRGANVEIKEAGTHTVTYYSVDNAGNIEAKQTLEVKIDEAPPVTVSDIKNAWSNKDVQVKLTATDDLSGVKTTYYSVDGGQLQEGTSFTVTGEGIHKVTFYSVDNAGNIEQANTAEVKIDKTAPTVTLAPIKSEYVMGDKLTLSYTAADNLSGIATSVMTVNGQVVANGTTLTLQPGEYTVQVTATDNAGNKTTTTVQQKFVVAILAEMEVTPGVINPNPGIFTVRLTMPKGYKYNFDLSTVSVNGAKVRGNGNPEGQAASGMFKFERMDVEKWIMPETTLVFRGYTKDGYLVIAKKTVKVNDADSGKGNGKGK